MQVFKQAITRTRSAVARTTRRPIRSHAVKMSIGRRWYTEAAAPAEPVDLSRGSLQTLSQIEDLKDEDLAKILEKTGPFELIEYDKLELHPTPKVKLMVQLLQQLTFAELMQFMKAMEKISGIDSRQLVAASSAPAAAAAPAAAPAEEKKEEKPAAPKVAQSKFDLKLVSFPDGNKFKILKEVRNIKPGMNLMESKAMIEGLPKVIFKEVNTKNAEEWKKALTDAGAVVELI